MNRLYHLKLDTEAIRGARVGQRSLGGNEADRDPHSRVDLPWVGCGGVIPPGAPGISPHWVRTMVPLQGEHAHEGVQ